MLTGAGISAESGVPTFRGDEGLWKRHRPEKLATPEAFRRNPRLVWEWYRYRQALVEKTRPNDAHRALARLEEGREGFLLVTQNIDGHHERAGSRKVVELHGNLFRARCDECGERRSMRGETASTTIPRCARGHEMRPDVVWFGEALPVPALEEAWKGATQSDLFLVIGTSAQVHPAASLPLAAKESGSRVVEVNTAETVLTDVADLVLRGRAAKIVPLIARVEKGA